jgi:hypothetical protein
MELPDFLNHVSRGAPIKAGSKNTCSCTGRARSRCGSSPNSTPGTAPLTTGWNRHE